MDALDVGRPNEGLDDNDFLATMVAPPLNPNTESERAGEASPELPARYVEGSFALIASERAFISSAVVEVLLNKPLLSAPICPLADDLGRPGVGIPEFEICRPGVGSAEGLVRPGVVAVDIL